MMTITGHQGSVCSLTLTHYGSRIISASYDKTLMVWDSETGQPALKMHGHEYPVKSVDVSPDGRVIVSGSVDRTVRIWDAGSDGNRGHAPHTEATPDHHRIGAVDDVHTREGGG